MALATGSPATAGSATESPSARLTREIEYVAEKAFEVLGCARSLEARLLTADHPPTAEKIRASLEPVAGAGLLDRASNGVLEVRHTLDEAIEVLSRLARELE